MVKRTTPIRVICFFVLAGCAALCQELPSSAWKSLPNAPSSIQPPTQAEGFHTFFFNSAGVRGTGYYGMQPSVAAHYQIASIRKKSSAYAPSNNTSFIGRASYAVSSIFIARDGSGKGRLNSSYFFGMLTSVAAQAASRSPGIDPLRRHSTMLVRPLAVMRASTFTTSSSRHPPNGAEAHAKVRV